MRHDGDVVRGRHGRDLEQLREPAHPHDVGLHDVEVAALDELAEAVAAVLVLARRELRLRVRALEQREAVGVVGAETLLPPVDVEVLAGADQVDRVADVQAHVAVDHEGEVRADALAVLAQERDVLGQAKVALLGAVGQREFGAPEAVGLCRHGLRAGAVEVEDGAAGAADELVDGLVADLAEEVPEGEVDGGDGGDGEALASVEHGGAVHLFEEVVRVAGVGAEEEALEVLVDEPACGGA